MISIVVEVAGHEPLSLEPAALLHPQVRRNPTIPGSLGVVANRHRYSQINVWPLVNVSLHSTGYSAAANALLVTGCRSISLQVAALAIFRFLISLLLVSRISAVPAFP